MSDSKSAMLSIVSTPFGLNSLFTEDASARHALFNKFKLDHHRTYDSVNEEASRFKIFGDNLKVAHYALLCHAMACYVMLWHAMLCYATLRYAMRCYDMRCYGMLCYAMLCDAMLCYAML